MNFKTLHPSFTAFQKPGLFLLTCASLSVISALGQTAVLAPVKNVELQPLVAQVKRVIEGLDYLGAPLSTEERQQLDGAMANTDSAAAVAAIQQVLDNHCLVGLTINPEMRVKAAPGPAGAELVAEGWRTFLIKVQNEAG